MRKSHLKRLKRDAEEAWRALTNAARGPQAAQDRYEKLPSLIDEAKERLAEITALEDEARAKLTKPLDEYTRRGGKYVTEKAQVAATLGERQRTCQHILNRLVEEYAGGLEPKLAAAEERLEKACQAFADAEHALCQYAVFYARERRDVDLVWTSEDEGKWTLEGTVAGIFDGEARKITMKKLILYLVEPQSRRSDDEEEQETKRKVKAKEWNGNGTYRLFANDLYKAMRGLSRNAYVDIAGCTVQVKRLRKYLKLAGNVIELELPEPEFDVDEEGAEFPWGYRESMTTRASPEGFRSHRATWKHVLEVPEVHVQIAP